MDFAKAIRLPQDNIELVEQVEFADLVWAIERQTGGWGELLISRATSLGAVRRICTRQAFIRSYMTDNWQDDAGRLISACRMARITRRHEDPEEKLDA